MNLALREATDLVAGLGTQGWLRYGLAAAAFGYVVPSRYGRDFLDVYFLLAYACLPSLFVSPMAADAVRDGRPPSPVRHRAQTLAVTGLGWIWGLAVVAFGLAVVGTLPPAVTLASAAILSLGLTFFSTAGVSFLALSSKTARAAKSLARRGFLMALLAIVMWSRMAPAEGKDALDLRLAPGRLAYTALPAAAVFGVLGLLLLTAGARRRQEEAEGPLFKL